MSTISAHGINKSFGELRVLRDITLSCAHGAVTCIIGPSGSGKSTLLRCMNHLEQPDSGYVSLDGEIIGYEPRRGHLVQRPDRAVEQQRQHIGMVFQRFNLFGHLTAGENVMLAPRKLKGTRSSAARDIAERVLEEVALSDKFDAYPKELSGGQQQRVAIARALAMDPKVILFDEPTSALDPELVGEVLTTIAKLASEGMTMVVVTHELAFAREAADTLVFMADGQIVETGDPRTLLDAPNSPRLASFVSRMTR